MFTTAQDNFAHGEYGDDSGVVFYGPPVEGFWKDRLVISDRFIDPLFCAVVDRSLRPNTATLPRIVADWLQITGWVDAQEVQEMSPADAKEFIAAIADISEEDVAPHIAGVTTEECVRCAGVISEFLRDRVNDGVPVYIDND